MDEGTPRFGLHLVTLGVADLSRAGDFYRAMGLERCPLAAEGVAFFKAGNILLSLYPRDRLAEDATAASTPVGPFAGLTLACNVAGPEEVAAILSRAVAAGGRRVKEDQKVFWGGISGYFADLDGHLWEVAYNPFFPFDGEGRLTVPPQI